MEVIHTEMVRYIRHLAERVEKHMRAIPKDKVYFKPFVYGNSMGHLILHLTGNLNHYIGAGIAGTGYVRDRPKEFADPNPPPADEALNKFREAVEMMIRTLEAQKAEDWGKLLDAPHPPIQTRFGMFLVCTAHLNNHIGQMSWMVQALGYSTNEPPVW